MKLAKSIYFSAFPALLALLATGCVAVQTAKFDVSSSNVPAIRNSGDRYCVIRIDEERQSKNERGQSPPPVAKVQARLAATQPEWFSSGVDAIPIVVHIRSSGIHGSMTFLFFLENMAGTITLGLIPYTFDKELMDFSTDISCGNGRMTGNSSFTGTTIIKAGNPLTMNEATFPKSRGWKPIKPTDPKPHFDQNADRWLDAICASVALAVQRLTPEERKALRENNEAWWLDAKLGNKRNRPVSIVHTEPASAEPSAPAPLESIHPKILSQSWDSRTRTGSIVFKVADRAALDEGVAWLRDEYLPEYCQTLGVTVSVDSPAGTPAADIRVDGISPLENDSFLLNFNLAE